MAKLVLGIGCSHGPSIQTSPENWAKLADGDTRDPRFNYQALLAAADPAIADQVSPQLHNRQYAAAHEAMGKLANLIREAQLDVVVVVSNQHRVPEEEHHPVFGVFTANTFPVAKRAKRQLERDREDRFISESERAKEDIAYTPGHTALATHLIDTLIQDDFDIACTDRIRQGAGLDDAFIFPLEWLMKGHVVPMVPFMISRDLPNQATAGRCYDLGTALRRAIEAWPGDERIGLIASGGLSHQIVDEPFDRGVIAALESGDSHYLKSLPRDQLNKAPGTPETLNWVTLAAAMSPLRLTLVDYIPCYRSAAGTGHGLAFGYWQ